MVCVVRVEKNFEKAPINLIILNEVCLHGKQKPDATHELNYA